MAMAIAKFKCKVGGTVLELNSLDSETDKAFCDLHQCYVSNIPVKIATWGKMLSDFLERAQDDTALHDRLFENFTIIWKHLLASNQYRAAEELWQKFAIEPVLEWEKNNPTSHVHKGTPYYFWGETSVLRGDLDTGFALMHMALESDKKTYGADYQESAAYAFVTLNDSHMSQQFKAWTARQAQFLEKVLVEYRTHRGGTLTLQNFTTNCLLHFPLADIIFIFGHAVARLNHLELQPNYLWQSPFAGQLQINLLFDLAVVTEATLAVKIPNDVEPTLIHYINYLAECSGAEMSFEQLENVSDQKRRLGFAVVLEKLLEGTLRFKEGTIPAGLPSDLALTYLIRNHAAHTVEAADAVWKRYPELRQALFSTLFCTVETFYL